MTFVLGTRSVFTAAEVGFNAAVVGNGATVVGVGIDLQRATLVTFYYSIASASALSTAIFSLRLQDRDGAFNPAANGLTLDSGPLAVGIATITGRMSFGFPTTQTTGGGVVASEPVVLSRFVRLDISEVGGVGGLTVVTIVGWAQ